MQQSSDVMTWSEGVTALLTFGIIMFLLWVYAAVLVAGSGAAAPAHVLRHVERFQAIQDRKAPSTMPEALPFLSLREFSSSDLRNDWTAPPSLTRWRTSQELCVHAHEARVIGLDVVQPSLEGDRSPLDEGPHQEFFA